MDDELVGPLLGLCFIIVTGVIISISRYRSRIQINFEDLRYDPESDLAKDYMYAVLRHQFDAKIRHVEITADNYLSVEQSAEAKDFTELRYQDILDYWNDLTGRTRKQLISSSKCTTLIFSTQHGPRRIDAVVGKQDQLLGLWLKL